MAQIYDSLFALCQAPFFNLISGMHPFGLWRSGLSENSLPFHSTQPCARAFLMIKSNLKTDGNHNGIKATDIGKLRTYLFDAALESKNAGRARVLMIGDRVATDILGARRVGIKSMLVKTGEFTESDLAGDDSRILWWNQ